MKKILKALIRTPAERSMGPEIQQVPVTPAAQFGADFVVSASGNDMAVLTAQSSSTAPKPFYIYTRTGQTWALQQSVTVVDPAGRSFFIGGLAISDDGNTAAVGCPYRDSGSDFISAVYIYTRSGAAWTLQQRIDGTEGGFGISLSFGVAGNDLAVGYPSFNSGRGSVNVYTRSAGVWSLQQTLTRPLAAVGDNLGQSVTIQGNTIAAGAPNVNSTPLDTGAVAVFTRSGGVWSLETTLVIPAVAEGTRVGSRVALSQDERTLAVTSLQGRLYSWVKSGPTWTRLDDYVPAAGGVSNPVLSATGGTMLVGVPNPAVSEASILSRTPTGWARTNPLTPTPPQASDGFGSRVGMSNDARHVLVAAPARDSGASTDCGAVFYFYV